MRPSLPNVVIEPCEARRLMSVAASVGARTLFVYGDDQPNGIALDRAGSDIVVRHYVNGGYATLAKFPIADVESIRVFGRGGGDTITVDDGVQMPARIDGGLGADWIKGGGGETYLYGNGKNDDVDDNAADSLFPGTGNTFQYGQGGDDLLHTSLNGSSALYGNDVLVGGDGNDRIYAGGTRPAQAYGAGGDDTLVPATDQPVEFYGGAGSDTIDYSDAFYGAYVDLTGNEKSGFLGNAGANAISLFGDVENAVGHAAKRNVVYGNNLANRLVGGNADDLLEGRGGNDTLHGNDGADTIDGGDGDDLIYAGKGADSVFARGGNDRVYGGAGDDLLYGEGGNDKLYGEAGNDTIHGGAGTDRLVGGFGNDRLIDRLTADIDLFFGGNEDGTGNAADFDTADANAWDILLGIDKKV